MELPVAWANYISIAGFLFLGIIVWAIPRALIFAEASDKSSWRDIRIWATVLIGIQLGLYLVFT
jgi:uncharacterized membrane protein|tara:strand:+ start:122 stop:313 length:192 start_codon:yes stop_codon:yes gene_type:complete